MVAGGDAARRLLVKQGHDLVHQCQLLLLQLGLRQCRQGDLAELAKVAGQALGGFGGVERPQVVQALLLAGQGQMDRVAEGGRRGRESS
jgi:hypothetical protein